MAFSLAAAVGVPGLSGFVGQSLVMMGGYSKHPAVLVVMASSLLLMTVSFFGVYRELFFGFGEERVEQEGAGELLIRQRLFLFPLVILMVFFGLYPRPLLKVIRPTVEQLLSPKESPASGDLKGLPPATEGGQ
jgi:NADH-quinone oxidoreductase subunit M